MTSTATSVRVLLSRETTGGALVLLGALCGLLLANSPAQPAFHRLAETPLGLLTVGEWAQDGLLALFFFTVGLELIQELRVGSLRSPRRAAVPILAACGGVVVPAVVYTAVVVASAGGEYVHGWAIPTATDIAFALSVLVLVGRGLPGGLRVFLLTLAVVDDLIGILVIAVFYSHGIHPLALMAAVAMVAAFGWLARRSRMRWWLLAPVAALGWLFMHFSGVHTTVAGVALGLVVPARRRPGELISRAARLGQIVQPVSNTVALPVFAVFAAAVPILQTGEPGRPGMLASPVVWGIVAALVVGKPVGVLTVTAAVTRWTPFRLPDGVTMRSLLPVGLLCGIGFTVSMLVASLSFQDPDTVDQAHAAVLLGSVISAAAGGVLLRRDRRRAADRGRGR